MPNLLLKPTLSPLLSFASLFAIWIGAAGGGWLMAAFALPWYGWVVTVGLVIYLCQVGYDGIALANLGLILTLSMATLKKAWPAALDATLPRTNARLWALSLLLIWIGAILGLYLLVHGRWATQQVLRYLNVSVRYAASLLALFTLSAGFVGWFVFSLTPYLDVIAP